MSNGERIRVPATTSLPIMVALYRFSLVGSSSTFDLSNNKISTQHLVAHKIGLLAHHLELSTRVRLASLGIEPVLLRLHSVRCCHRSPHRQHIQQGGEIRTVRQIHLHLSCHCDYSSSFQLSHPSCSRGYLHVFRCSIV